MNRIAENDNISVYFRRCLIVGLKRRLCYFLFTLCSLYVCLYTIPFAVNCPDAQFYFHQYLFHQKTRILRIFICGHWHRPICICIISIVVIVGLEFCGRVKVEFVALAKSTEDTH